MYHKVSSSNKSFSCSLISYLLKSSTTIIPLLFISNVAHTAETYNSEVALEEIVITADRRDSYSADYVQAGTFRNGRVLDTPMTANILTKELLNAQQALTISDAVRNTAGVTASQINSVIYSNLTIRGIAVGNLTNYRLNGILPIVNFIDMPIEDKDRVEVLKGASGLYYGFASPAGVVNLVTERPNEDRIGVEVTGNSHGAYGGNIDIDRVWGKSGLRVNAGASTIETGIDKTSGRRNFISAAYDWKPTDKLLFELDGEYIYKTVTEPTEFSLPAPVDGVITLPPLQPLSHNLGADWLKAEGYEYNLLSRTTYNFSDAWSAKISIGRSYFKGDRRYSSFSGYDLATGDGTLNIFSFPDVVHKNTIYRGDLAGAFETGPLVHEMVIGISRSTTHSIIAGAVSQGGFTQNLYNPVDIPEQPRPEFILRNINDSRDFGYYITDRAKLGDWAQFTIGYRWTDYRSDSLTSHYQARPGSLSYSALFKPLDWVSVYGAYVEGLEEGGIAPGIASNPGEVLPAALSKQWEAGIKAEPKDGFLLTMAYFAIERTSAYLNEDNFFIQDGKAKYRGVEFSAAGEIITDLSLSASLTYIDAKQKSGAASVIGNRIENTPKFTGTLFLEYRVPAVPGLSVSGGVFHTGDRAVNAGNNAFAPGYTLFDLGASYMVDIQDQPIIFRVNAHNITGKKYWQATGAGLLAAGVPSVVKFSVSTNF